MVDHWYPKDMISADNILTTQRSLKLPKIDQNKPRHLHETNTTKNAENIRKREKTKEKPRKLNFPRFILCGGEREIRTLK